MLMPFIVKLVAGWCMLLTRWILNACCFILRLESLSGMVSRCLSLLLSLNLSAWPNTHKFPASRCSEQLELRIRISHRIDFILATLDPAPRSMAPTTSWPARAWLLSLCHPFGCRTVFAFGCKHLVMSELWAYVYPPLLCLIATPLLPFTQVPKARRTPRFRCNLERL